MRIFEKDEIYDIIRANIQDKDLAEDLIVNIDSVYDELEEAKNTIDNQSVTIASLRQNADFMDAVLSGRTIEDVDSFIWYLKTHNCYNQHVEVTINDYLKYENGH